MSNDTTKIRPTHRIYAVTKIAEDKSRWTELGIAFPHWDGKGFNLVFNASAIGEHQLVVREAKDTKAVAEAAR